LFSVNRSVILRSMKFGHSLLLGSAALLVAAVTVRATALPAAPPTHPPPIPGVASSSDEYVGSQACARCHQETYDVWERSLHIRMTKPVAEAIIVGDFDGARFSAHGRAFEFGRAGGKPFMRISFGGAPPETFAVDYTLGHKRYQGYLSRLPDGRLYVLPAFWHVESGRWIDWKEITPIPDGAHDLRQIWNSNCFNCHATNLAQGFNIDSRKYATTWTEMGIGCEACHGPGQRHIAAIDAWHKDPSLKPGGTLETYSPRNGTPRQAFDTCAYCHGNKRNVFVGFRAGDRYEDYAVPFLISEPIPATDLQGEFWPDGRPNRFNRPQALTLSGCFKAGEATCTSCHSAHGSDYPYSLKVDITQGRSGDQLCTQCHATKTAEAQIEQHTFHKAGSEGSRCIGCHMSDVNWRLLIRRRDHTFQAPVPEMTTSYGVPNACTTCHDNRSPEWAARQMDAWWGDTERRQKTVSIADTMYRAGTGDASVLPELARLAVDRSNGTLIRASAVEFMEQLALGKAGAAGADAQSQTSFGYGAKPAPPPAGKPAQLTPRQINALIGAASDPEPTVRAQAVNALLASGDRERVITPLAARLVDPARVVRARAAEALLAFGIATLPGAAGVALERAQNDLADALRAFPDSASNHAALGMLEAERGNALLAHSSLDAALRLDPKAVRAHVIKGIMAAREGRYDNALDWWRKAKSLDPTYPNIDRLIEEAEKRKASGAIP
jgi:predicted CXXCH cytochrome family protein